MKHFFKKTKDPRGLIYCKLGLGEIAMLKGRKLLAKKYISSSIDDASRYGFQLEKCHAEMIMSYLLGELKTNCYNKLGLGLDFKNAPFNLP